MGKSVAPARHGAPIRCPVGPDVEYKQVNGVEYVLLTVAQVTTERFGGRPDAHPVEVIHIGVPIFPEDGWQGLVVFVEGHVQDFGGEVGVG